MIRNEKILSAKEVKVRFERVLNEIRRTGGPITIERGGRAIAVILSVDKFKRLAPRARRPKARRDLALAAFGMWSTRRDIDDEWLVRGRARWQSEWTH